MKPVLVAIADDFSGASDQAGMLANAGVASLLVLDDRFEVGEGWEAVTVATRLRALEILDAQDEAERLFRLARALRPHMIQYKYCSTFDSTPCGNIGPILDVARDVFGLRGTIVMPALPVNRRTTYLGTHFVREVPLNESPMREHPLNPMTDANLVRWLRRQTPHGVGLLPYPVVAAGPEAIRKGLRERWRAEEPYVVVDCLSQEHVRFIAQAVADLRFISGSSALPMELPAIWRREGLLATAHTPAPLRRRGSAAPVMMLAGSCAEQTLRQISVAHAAGTPIVVLDAAALIRNDPEAVAEALFAPVRQALASAGVVLVASSTEPATRAEVVRRAAVTEGLSARSLGLRIEHCLSALARLAHDELKVRHFLCAGGETSGAVAAGLGLQALEIMHELAPGVPLCRALPGRNVAIALKGGNFGADGFFAHAVEMARRVQLDA